VRVVVEVVAIVVVVLVVVVVGAMVVVVVVVGGTVVVVVSGADRLSMSWENPNAACRPAAAPIPGGSASATGSASTAAVDGAPSSASSLLGENAAKAAIARSAITTQVANARSLVNLTPERFQSLNKEPRCASMRGMV
jgi:hypothetical protein